MKIFYKKDGQVFRFVSSGGLPLNDVVEDLGVTECVVLPNDNNEFDRFPWCLKIENGVLSYDLALLKAEIHKVRKAYTLSRYAPYDKIISDINALEIPEEYFGGDYAAAKANAETSRAGIRAENETLKTRINNATTAEAVLAIWQEIINV